MPQVSVSARLRQSHPSGFTKCRSCSWVCQSSPYIRSHVTVTEDLDLSYRAQLLGWKFVFLPDLVAPAEVPVEMNAFKSQQHRWAKGSIQVCLKLLPRILQSDVPFGVKAEAFLHLTANFNYLLMSALSVLMFPSMVIRYNMGWYEMLARRR